MKLGALFAPSSLSSTPRPPAAEPNPLTDAPHRSKLASFSPARHWHRRTPRKAAAPAATSSSFFSLKPSTVPVLATPSTLTGSPATPQTSVGSPAVGDATPEDCTVQTAVTFPIAPPHYYSQPVAQARAEGLASGSSPSPALSNPSSISLFARNSSNATLKSASPSTPTRTSHKSHSPHTDPPRSRLPRSQTFGPSLSPHSPQDPPATRMARSGSLYSISSSYLTMPRKRNRAPTDSTPTPTPAPDPNGLGSELPAQLMHLIIAYGDGLVTADEYRTLRAALLSAAVQADTPPPSYLSRTDSVPTPDTTPAPERSSSLSCPRSVRPSARLLSSERSTRPETTFTSHPLSSGYAPSDEEGDTTSVGITRTQSILKPRVRSSTAWMTSASVLSISTPGSNETLLSSDKREADQVLMKQVQSDRQTTALAKATAMMDLTQEIPGSKCTTRSSSPPKPEPRQTAKPRAQLQAELGIIEAERKALMGSIELVVQHYGRSLPPAASTAQASSSPTRTYAPRARSGLMHRDLKAGEGSRKRDSSCETLVSTTERASQSAESLGSSSAQTVHRHSLVALLRRPSSKTSIPSSNPSSRPASVRRSSVIATEPNLSNKPDSQPRKEPGDELVRIWTAVAKRYDDRTALLQSMVRSALLREKALR